MSLSELKLCDKQISPVHNGVFKYFLELGKCSRVLIVDNSEGGSVMAISQHAGSLFCLCRNLKEAITIKSRLIKNGIKDVSLIIGDLLNFPFQNNVFSHLCMHKFTNNNLIKYGQKGRSLLGEMERILRDGGECYISILFPDNISYLKRVFFRRCMPFLKSYFNNNFREIANIYHYKTFDNLSFVKVCWRNKSCYPGQIFFQTKRRLFGNNIGMIYQKRVEKRINKQQNYFLQEVKKKLGENLNIRLSVPDLLRVGSGDSLVADYGKVIVRIPLTETGLQRCMNNFATLKRLANIKSIIQFPRALTNGNIYGQPYFAESKILGISMDMYKLSGTSFKNIHSQAYNLLIDKEWFTLEKMNERNFDLLVKNEVNKLIPYVSSNDCQVLNEILKLMSQFFICENLPLIIQHGDFKTSNFIYSHGLRKRLVGIIDWDMASNPGLPLIDLFSMQIYKHNVKNKDLNHYVKDIWPLTIANEENKLIYDYIGKMNISVASLKLIAVFAIIRYLNKYYYVPEIKRNPAWYNEMISGYLIPICLECLSKIKQQ
jgi:SAM-dependent methyltransferase